MNITILRAFPDAYRQSMTLYADFLESGLRKSLPPKAVIKSFLPKPLWLKPALLRYFSQYLFYPTQAERLPGDIFHIIDHSYSHITNHLPSKKVVITFHDAIGFSQPVNALRRLLRNANLKGLQRAAFIICDSQASQKALLSLINYPIDQTAVVYPGLDSQFGNTKSENLRKELDCEHKTCFLHVGHTGAYKNIPGLLHIFALIKEDCPNAFLLKSGTPFTAEQNKLIDQLRLKDSIRHLGLISREKLPALYQTSDVVLLPSFNEGFGFPVLEAMASGKPIIASNRGSLPEIAHPELIVEPNDYMKFKELSLRLIRDEKFRQTVKDFGLQQVKNFSWNRTIADVERVYRELLNRGGIQWA